MEDVIPILKPEPEGERRMPVQNQASTLAQRFGSRISQSNAEHKDKPLDLGFKRLPAGIKNGKGKLHTIAMKFYGQDEKIVALRGQEYLHVVGVVMSPESHEGEKIAGAQMFLRFPLCDIPANPQNAYSKPKSFSHNWYEFQQFFMRFGINPPNENQQTDPTGAKTLAYYMAAIQTLSSGRPRYYSFETRAWRPAGAKEDRIEEEWGKECEWDGKVDPGSGVSTQPSVMAPPPTGPDQTLQQALGAQEQQMQEPPFNEFASGTSELPPTTGHPVADKGDIVAALVEIAMADPQGATEDSRNATAQLEDLAWAAGWTKEQTASAADWAAIGDMALNSPPATTSAPVVAPTGTATNSPTILAVGGGVLPAPVAGMKFKFAKRTKNGGKLTDAKGTEFPAQDVEVVSVNEAAKTCIVKSVKDGKTIVDIRTKVPVDVKFEWLE